MWVIHYTFLSTQVRGGKNMKNNIERGIGFLFVCVLFLAAIPMMADPVIAERSSNIVVTSPNIAVNIENSFVTATTSLSLTNEGTDPAEFDYPISIPRDAFLTNLTIEYNGSTYYGEVKEARQAEEEYQQAVNESKSAIKLEKISVSDFFMTLNLLPDDPMDLSYTYNTFLVKELGGFEFSVIPSDHLPGYTSLGTTVEFNIATPTMITAEDAIDLDSGLIEHHGTKGFSLTAQIPNEDSDRPAGVTFETADTALNGTMRFHTSGENTYFVHTFAPGLNELGNKPVKKDIVFIVDRSGSMSGDKMDQTKEAFGVIVDQLSAEYDKFNIISFSTEYTVWKDELQIPGNTTVGEAKNYIEGISASGGTNIIDTLEKGLEIFPDVSGRMKIIVFLTDGNPTVGDIQSTPAICSQVRDWNTERVSVFSLGVGYDMDFEFLEKLSFMNYARAFRIDDEGDISEQITSFYDTISTPLIFDLEMDYGNAVDVYQRHAPYLFKGQEHCVVGKVSVPGNKVVFNGIGSAAVNASMSFTGNFSPVEREDPFLEKFWAFMHIRWCQEKMLMEDDPSIYKTELIETALEHQIVTEYTTMILVVHDEVEEEPPEDEDDDRQKEEAEQLGGGDGGDLTYDDTGNGGGDTGDTSKFTYPDADDSTDNDGPDAETNIGNGDKSDTGGFTMLFGLLVTITIIIIVLVLYSRRKR